MRKFSISVAGLMGLIAVLAVADSAEAAPITVNFDLISPVVLGNSPVDLTGQGVFFAGNGNAVVAAGVSGANSLFYQGGNVTISTSNDNSTFFDLSSLVLDTTFGTATPGTLSVNGYVFNFVTGQQYTLLPAITNVSSVVITSTTPFVFLDNFIITPTAAAAVPEPASAAFLGLGSLAFVVRRLRRRSSVAA
jgi:hypothetical protein